MEAILLNRLLECLRAYKPSNPPLDVDAAVNIILRSNATGIAEMLLIKRKVDPKDPWSGDIAFPGGRVERSDRNFIDTALRETFEEVGIPKENLEVITVLDVEETRGNIRYIVAPIVSKLKVRNVSLRLGGEVERAFWVELKPMREQRVLHPRRGAYVKAYIIFGEVVWGMTKRLIDKLIDLYSKCSGQLNLKNSI